MQIKKHLSGGTLRTVMAEEIKRVIAKFSGEDQAIEKAALELGVTPRTIRVWKGSVDKGGWPELQGYGGMERLTKAVGRASRHRTKRTRTKKKTSQAARHRA